MEVWPLFNMSSIRWIAWANSLPSWYYAAPVAQVRLNRTISSARDRPVLLSTISCPDHLDRKRLLFQVGQSGGASAEGCIPAHDSAEE